MEKVLICTGGLVTPKERSALGALRKQVAQWRASEGAWLELKVKAVVAEPLLAARLTRRDAEVARFYEEAGDFDAPELTEVVLAGLLEAEGLPFEIMTYDDLFSRPRKVERKLQECGTVFASSTLLRDLSELEPLIRRLKRPHNRIVVGGALAGSLCRTWEGMPEVDVLAVGYGERLVPALAGWIRSGGRDQIHAPEGGKIVARRHTQVVHAGLPAAAGASLDFLPTPDWALAERTHGRRFHMVHYESVRGCPYRCSFCNYPFLFDDTKFRYKSAARIAADWERYVERGAEFITCLDSLFTMPKKRLVELCETLIARGVKVKWICYARSTDLVDEETVALMKAAGCHQLQIGIESGDSGILDNMNKRAPVEANRRALENCRRHGLTTVATMIVGFPGETAATLERTFEFLQRSPPDFHFLCTFSTRVADVPVLSAESRARFGLRVVENPRTVAPYWSHDTMSCAQVGNHVRALSQRLMQGEVSLDAAVFYPGILRYRPEQRVALLAFQRRAMEGHPWLRRGFDLVNRWIDSRLARDVRASLEGTSDGADFSDLIPLGARR